MGGCTGSDDAKSARSLRRAVELGCNFFDTAYVYGKGRSERLIGEVVRVNLDRRLYTVTNATRPRASKNMCIADLRTPGSNASTLCDCILGRTCGRWMNDGRVRLTT